MAILKLAFLCLVLSGLALAEPFTINFTKYIKSKADDSISCEYMDQYSLNKHDSPDCTSDLSKGNCVVNYTSHSDGDALWQLGDIAGSIKSITQYSGVCVSTSGAAFSKYTVES